MLTEKRQRFVDEYLIDLNGTRAVIRAGYKAKNDRTAAEVSKQLLKIPEIREAIDERLGQLQSERIASVEEVLEYLTGVLRGDGIEEVTVVEGQGAGFSVARNIDKSLAPKDRLKAAELLGKRYCLFSDKLQVAVKAPVTFVGEGSLEY